MPGSVQATTAAPFRTRLRVLFATAAPVAVVHRTGPKRHHQLLTWDLKDDTFTPGQWMKGLVRLMDLSPHGDKLIYWAAQYHPGASWTKHRAISTEEDAEGYEPLNGGARALRRAHAKRPYRKLPRYVALAPPRLSTRENQGAWTAVSTPPWFSALAIWPCIGHWTGGGYFTSGHHLVLYEAATGLTPIANVPIPTSVTISSFADPALPPIPLNSIAVDPARQPMTASAKIAAALALSGARYFEWAHVRASGDLLFACDGSIYRLPQWDGTVDHDLLSKAKHLIDLSGERFQLVRPPRDALRW